MARTVYHNEGYTRGGLDVVTGVNLFFKSILLFPIFVLAAFVGLTMMKHVLFNGIPSMNAPTEEQREELRTRDAEISLNNSETPSPYTVQPPVLPPPTTHSRVGSNGLPYVYPTARPLGVLVEEQIESTYSEEWNTEILEDPFS